MARISNGTYRATIIATLLLGMLLIGSISSVVRASERDLYDFLWLDPDKSVYVLQNKTFKKKHSVYGSVGYLRGLSSEYQDTQGFKLETGFFFHEEWAVDFFLVKLFKLRQRSL